MTLRDLPEIARMQADAETMATLGGVRDAAQSRRMLEDWVAHWDAHGFGLWIARDAASNEFAGRGGLKHCVVGGRPEIEVAYGFLPAFWGRGLASEMAEASVRAGFEELGLADLVCFTMTTNRASQRVMEKAGFVFEREIEHAGLPHVLCRLRAAQWRDRAR
jgi:ribosomal-protein-alanine N-acetyltransferase